MNIYAVMSNNTCTLSCFLCRTCVERRAVDEQDHKDMITVRISFISNHCSIATNHKNQVIKVTRQRWSSSMTPWTFFGIYLVFSLLPFGLFLLKPMENRNDYCYSIWEYMTSGERQAWYHIYTWSWCPLDFKTIQYNIIHSLLSFD